MTQPPEWRDDSPPPPGLEDRFATLEASSLALSADVRALTAALEVVNKLQAETRAIKRRNEVQERKLREVEKTATERSDRSQAVLRRLTVALAILLPIASILVYFVLFSQVTDLLNQTRSERLKSCQQRNDGVAANIRRERRLAAVEPNPDVAQIHTDSADELMHTIVNCPSAVKLVST